MGLLSACGLGLVDYLALKATGAVRTRPLAKSCILIWLDGGPSHLETFDPSPKRLRKFVVRFSRSRPMCPVSRFVSTCHARLGYVTG